MDVDEAFTTYVAQRRLQLFRTACLLCGDPHQAEDIVQDALARLYAAWPRASRGRVSASPSWQQATRDAPGVAHVGSSGPASP